MLEPRDSAAGLLVAPSLGPTLERDNVDRIPATMDRRDAIIAALGCALAVAATGVAEALVRAIAIVTNLVFYGRFSMDFVSPANHSLGFLVVLVPVGGGLVVGLMARYGSRAIRGHGIPEAMEQILTNDAKIPFKLTFLKPASAAVAIGTGGPFGAEGPIIATGGALGSAIGQFFPTSSAERKTLLAAGAAAGMTAIFGTPIAAVLIAIELLLFEYRARSVVPVALAAATAGGLRALLHGGDACFAMPDLGVPNATSGIVATLVGGVVGVAATYITRLVYHIEDWFERLPIHWMWWPALGAIVVGVIGIFEPRTLGVGYDNIEVSLGSAMTAGALAALVIAKLVSWAVALGSGTSGGTLAPLLTLGAGLGWLLATGVAEIIPNVDPRLAALVGMTAMFAGASRALLASIAFAVESTHQIESAGPVVAGVALAYFLSCLLMRTTIMTEKLARRGVTVGSEYEMSPLLHKMARDLASAPLVSVQSHRTAGETLPQLVRHQAYPVLDDNGRLIGVVTRNAIEAADPAMTIAQLIPRAPITCQMDETGRDVADRMAAAGVGRVIVVDGNGHPKGIITRSDLVAVFGK